MVCANVLRLWEVTWLFGVRLIPAQRWNSRFRPPLLMRNPVLGTAPGCMGSYLGIVGSMSSDMSRDIGSGSNQIRILTVDDHPLLREGIAGLVADQSDMSLVAEASNGREAIQQFRTHRPDITLMDLQMPHMNGLDAMVSIRSEFPEARIIILTTYTGDVQVLRALKAGARGYLLKNML